MPKMQDGNGTNLKEQAQRCFRHLCAGGTGKNLIMICYNDGLA